VDEDLDYTFAPSGTIYGCRAIKLDTVTPGNCYLGSLNSFCVGVSVQQSENPPGLIGNNTTPFVLAEPTSGSTYPYTPGGSGPLVPVYGPNRRCLIDVDPAFGGQIKPGDFVISGNSGYATKASPFGPWNQYVLGFALSFANANQSLNIKIQLFPWSPTGS